MPMRKSKEASETRRSGRLSKAKEKDVPPAAEVRANRQPPKKRSSAQLPADSLEATASASIDEELVDPKPKRRGRPLGSKNKRLANNTQASEAVQEDLKPKLVRPTGSNNKRPANNTQASEPNKKPGRPSKRQEVPAEEPASTDDGPPAKKQKPVNAQAQIHVGASEAGASEPELELVTKCKTDSCSEPTPEQQLELLPKQPDQAGQQLVPMQKRRGRPRKEKPDQAEQQLEPPKRGRPRKDQASQAIVVSPHGAKRKPKQSENKCISQCSPAEFVRIVLGKLKKTQNDPSEPGSNSDFVSLIKKINWHRVLDIHPVKLNKQLELSLIDCFDTDIDRLVINGQPIDIKRLVPKIIPLPNSGRAVNRDGDHGDSDLYDLFTDPGKGKSMPVHAGLKFLDNVEDERVFRICFILEAFAFIFAPKTNRNLEREYLQFFKNIEVDDLKDLKWCDLIADLLIEFIKLYKAGSAKYKMCGGCLLILVIIFHDLVTKVPGDKRFPRANHVTEDDLKTLEDLKTDDFKELAKQAKTLDELYKDYGLGKPSDQLYKDYQAKQVASHEQTAQSEGLETSNGGHR